MDTTKKDTKDLEEYNYRHGTSIYPDMCLKQNNGKLYVLYFDGPSVFDG